MQSCTAKFSACIALLAAVTGFAPGHARTGPGLQPPCRSAPGQGLHSAGPQGWVIPGGCVPSACPTAAPQLPRPAGSPPSRRGCARQLSQATSQLLLSVRGDLRGARQDRGHTGGLSLSSGTEGGWIGWEGSGVKGLGQFAAPLLGYLWAGGQRTLARPLPAMDAALRRDWPRWSWNRLLGPGQGRASHPAPQEARADGTGMGTGLRTDTVTSLLPPARQAPAPLKGALRGPAARGGAARGSAAENTGTSP